MSEQSASPVATRSAISLRTGTKVCILLALAALAAAVYFYFVPMTVRTQTGGVFSCGSASSPPTEDFQRNVCENLTDISLFRAYLFLALALISAVVGTLLFGVDRSTVQRRPRGYISEDGQFRAATEDPTTAADDAVAATDTHTETGTATGEKE